MVCNVVIVVGNSGDVVFCLVLMCLLDDDDFVVCEVVDWVFGWF